MKKRLMALAFLFCSLSGLFFAVQDKKEFTDYKEMRAYIGELFEQKKYAEAAALLESVLGRFPANVMANTYNLAAARINLGDMDKAVQALEEGHRRGVFYGIWDFTPEFWNPIRETPRFQAFLKANQTRIDEAQNKAVMTTEVVTPDGYDPARKYPLFIALHGGGESVADFKPNWTSPRLRAGFITVYVQSSQVANMRGFHWQDLALTRRDLEAAYKRVIGQYPVDASRVVIGGFSSGGFGSMAAALGNFIPVRGFVALCPVVPDAVRDEDIQAAKLRGLRGTLLTTEQDNRIEAQRAFIERLEKLGLKVEFHLAPNIGHWYPKDFEALLDKAIGLILPDGPGD
jgi:predicted esterase